MEDKGNNNNNNNKKHVGKISAENLYIFTSFIIFYNVQTLSVPIYAAALVPVCKYVVAVARARR